MAKRKNKKSKPPTTQSPTQTDRIKTAHNNFFEYVFSDLNHAREFLAVYGPREVISRLVLDDLDFQKDGFMDERLRNQRTDMFYEAPLMASQSSQAKTPSQQNTPTAPAHIYILFEHKSTSEADVLEQVLRYMSERWRIDRKNSKPLRPIIVIIVYHGEDSWSIPKTFVELFKDVDPIFHPYIPNFKYILFDTSDYTDSEILDKIASGSLQAALLLLKYIYDESLNERVRDIFEPLTATKLPREKLLAHLEAMLTYTTAIKNRVPDEVLDETVNELFAEEGITIMNIKERWMEKGKIEGIVEGMIEGKAKGIFEGKLEDKREMIIKVLNHISPLDETDANMITKNLAKIDDLDSLDTLVDAALDSHHTGLGQFMIQLITVTDEYNPS
ncbi:MAG: Rpn family recombination-promoting nuclease/putative transposase [Chloroflexota bacterium]